MRRALLVLFTASLLGPLVGCDEEEPATCPGEPELLAFELSASTVAPGGTLMATFEVDNFEFSMEGDHDHLARGAGDEPIVFRAATQGDSGCFVGHVHVYFDDLMTNPVAMLTQPEGEFVIPADATAGEHRLIARLQNADHTIIEPQILLEQTITVQ